MNTKDMKSLTEFEQKIIRLEVEGGIPVKVMITIPTIIQKGITFDIGISLLDKDMLPSFNNKLELEVMEDINRKNSIVIEFTPNEISTTKVENVVCDNIGFTRFYVIMNDKKHYSNPANVVKVKEYDLLWGDPHVHTTVGDCHPRRCRTRNLAYTVARKVYHLDWIAITDHVSCNPRGTEGKWIDNIANADLYNQNNEFTTLYAYETSMKGGAGGDNNVYLKSASYMYIDPWEEELNTKELTDRLNQNTEEYFIVPHHTTRSNKHGEISTQIYPGDTLMPVVEIHSKWGTSEFRGNPNPLHNIHTGPSYVQDLLKKGYYMGFIGGTDSHTSLTFTSSLESKQHDRLPGLTCVNAKFNTRDNIFNSIKNKECYATSGERIYLDIRINDNITMGQVVKKSNNTPIPNITIKCAVESEIKRIDIIRNGSDIYSSKIHGWNTTLQWQDNADWFDSAFQSEISQQKFVYYYIRITTSSGAQAWSSPIWFVS